MQEYERVIEALLTRLGQSNWDMLLGPIPAESQAFSMSLYFRTAVVLA